MNYHIQVQFGSGPIIAEYEGPLPTADSILEIDGSNYNIQGIDHIIEAVPGKPETFQFKGVRVRLS